MRRAALSDSNLSLKQPLKRRIMRTIQSKSCTMKVVLLLLLVAAAAALPISQPTYTLPVNANSSQNTPEQAVAAAKSYYDAQTDVTPGLCDHYVAVFYGHSSSGWPSAIDQWKGTEQPQLAQHAHAPCDGCFVQELPATRS